MAAAEGHLPELGDAREDAAENRGVPAATGAVEPVADWQRPFAVPSDDKSERADLLSPPAMPWEAREAP